MSIVDPMSAVEARVLCTYVRQSVPEVPEHERAEWAAATDALVERGMLARASRGILATPEGLAAALDMVPADVMRTASPPEGSAAARQDVPTRPSRARRTSGARSAPRASSVGPLRGKRDERLAHA